MVIRSSWVYDLKEILIQPYYLLKILAIKVMRLEFYRGLLLLERCLIYVDYLSYWNVGLYDLLNFVAF